MAYDILVNGANPGDMEVQPAPNFTKMYNKTNCEKLGITVPDDYTAIEGWQLQSTVLYVRCFSSAEEILCTDVRFYSENIRQIAEK